MFHHGQKVAELRGPDANGLRSLCSEWSCEAEREELCPYTHFPLKESEQAKFDDIKWNLVEVKLAENNSAMQTESINHPHALTTQGLAAEWLDVVKCIELLKDRGNWHSATFSQKIYDTVYKMMNWPLDKVSPVLNLLRIFVLHPDAAAVIARQGENIERAVGQTKRPAVMKGDFVQRVCEIAFQTDKSTTALLAMRTLCNLFARRAGARLMGKQDKLDKVLEAAQQVLQKYTLDESIRLAVIALYVNYSLLFCTFPKEYEEAKIHLLTSVIEMIQLDATSEMGSHEKFLYRCCVVIGTLIYKDENARSIANDLEINQIVQKQAKQYIESNQQIIQVTKEIELVLKAQTQK